MSINIKVNDNLSIAKYANARKRTSDNGKQFINDYFRFMLTIW